MNALIQFGSNANAVTTENPKTHVITTRLLTAKEFKTAKGLKGNEGTRQYNAYLRSEGASNPEGLIKKLASGELIVGKVADAKASMNLRLIKRDMLKDPAPKGDADSDSAKKLAEVTGQIDKLTALLRSLGATDADLAKATQ